MSIKNEEDKYNPTNCDHECKPYTCAFCDEMKSLTQNSRPCSAEENAQIMESLKTGRMIFSSATR